MAGTLGGATNRCRDRKGARDSSPFILAAADYVDQLRSLDPKVRQAASAPPELILYDSLMEFGTLYVAGAWADQPYALMRRLRVAHNVYSAWSQFRASKDWGRLQSEQPETWRIIEDILALRKERDNGRH